MTYDFTARRQDDLVLEDNFHASQRPGAADLVDEFETVEQGLLNSRCSFASLIWS